MKSEWNGGFGVTSSSKNFSLGGKTMERNTEYKMDYDFPIQFSGEGKGPTVCEVCIGRLAACLIPLCRFNSHTINVFSNFTN